MSDTPATAAPPAAAPADAGAVAPPVSSPSAGGADGFTPDNVFDALEASIADPTKAAVNAAEIRRLRAENAKARTKYGPIAEAFKPVLDVNDPQELGYWRDLVQSSYSGDPSKAIALMLRGAAALGGQDLSKATVDDITDGFVDRLTQMGMPRREAKAAVKEAVAEGKADPQGADDEFADALHDPNKLRELLDKRLDERLTEREQARVREAQLEQGKQQVLATLKEWGYDPTSDEARTILTIARDNNITLDAARERFQRMIGVKTQEVTAAKTATGTAPVLPGGQAGQEPRKLSTMKDAREAAMQRVQAQPNW